MSFQKPHSNLTHSFSPWMLSLANPTGCLRSHSISLWNFLSPPEAGHNLHNGEYCNSFPLTHLLASTSHLNPFFTKPTTVLELKSNHALLCLNLPVSFYHIETKIQTPYPGLWGHHIVGFMGPFLAQLSHVTLFPSLLAHLTLPLLPILFFQKPPGCPCLLSLVLVVSSAWIFCVFMRLPPPCQAGLRFSVASSKRPFLIPNLKQLLSFPLLYHTFKFLHSTHHNLTLCYLLIWFSLYGLSPPTRRSTAWGQKALTPTSRSHYIPASKPYLAQIATQRVFSQWINKWSHPKEILLGLECFAFLLWEWVLAENNFYPVEFSLYILPKWHMLKVLSFP